MSAFKLKSLGGCKPKSAEERFDASWMGEPNSGCWLWLGRERGSNNYGSLKVDGKNHVAHRYSYKRFVGEIPDGLYVLHRCDNPACVNPNHLFLGTIQDNTDDKVRKGRQAKGDRLSIAQKNSPKKPRGELAYNSKLSKAEVEQIRILAAERTYPQRKIAKMFGVTQALVSRIHLKGIWNDPI